MSDGPTHDEVKDALRAADDAAAPYVKNYPRVEDVEWPTDEATLEAEARTILADLRSQVDSIRYEASTDVDEDDIKTIKRAMAHLQGFLNDNSVDAYVN